MTATREPAGAPAESAPGAGSASDPALEVGVAFKGAMAAMRRMRGRQPYQAGTLSDAQFSLLFWLCERSPLSAGELATAASLSKAATTEMLEALEAEGLVRRERSTSDRRVVLTELSPCGERLVQERRALYETRLRRALAGFSPSELGAAARVLHALGQMFEPAEGAG